MDQSDITKATGSSYCFAYRQLPKEATVEQLQDYCSGVRRLFAPIAKDMDTEKNSIWVLRHYLAIKFIAASSLLAGSAEHSFKQNIQLAVPYFNYYALLSACRAYLLTSPQMQWDGQKTMQMTHENIMNRTADYMRSLDPSRKDRWRERMAMYRTAREMFSYKFPLSGPRLLPREYMQPDAAIELCRLIAELASLNSECLQAAVEKHSTKGLKVAPLPDHVWAYQYEVESAPEIDKEDMYRFGKYYGSWGEVSTLEVMTSDGLVDDLYGNWCDSSGDDSPNTFNPDDCSRLVLAL